MRLQDKTYKVELTFDELNCINRVVGTVADNNKKSHDNSLLESVYMKMAKAIYNVARREIRNK
ncbi:hypothetical protein AKUH3B209X_08970 [Apilactobacillus kunkeei]|nr:hypothetical protein AKUG0406_09000 [Apilactobacillus kunkeei]CAI2613487.1 hypothetical protein AKUH3B102A_09060 [Apilactobacillus kunkeei]CAI2615288.1 hypothetical protein AKUG0403_09000 [Apilactobacillus kunkeei]CAI2616119.1 hypothetical protein AKUH3B205J_09060 [Apilactobacillus kunkeei]CAI2616371.1 hypothetical protein AKUH3B209X_08970 [Apilactobacillus kunkeei]